MENEEGAVISDAARKIIPVHWGSFAFFSKKHGQKGGISNEFALEIYINYINQRMKRCFSLLLWVEQLLPIICRTDVKSLWSFNFLKSFDCVSAEDIVLRPQPSNLCSTFLKTNTRSSKGCCPRPTKRAPRKIGASLCGWMCMRKWAWEFGTTLTYDITQIELQFKKLQGFCSLHIITELVTLSRKRRLN